MTYRVEYGVKGSYRISTRTYDTITEANAKAKRWSQSNSIGSYWSQVIDSNDEIVESYNV
jgi:hypothetical protein